MELTRHGAPGLRGRSRDRQREHTDVAFRAYVATVWIAKVHGTDPAKRRRSVRRWCQIHQRNVTLNSIPRSVRSRSIIKCRAARRRCHRRPGPPERADDARARGEALSERPVVVAAARPPASIVRTGQGTITQSIAVAGTTSHRGGVRMPITPDRGSRPDRRRDAGPCCALRAVDAAARPLPRRSRGRSPGASYSLPNGDTEQEHGPRRRGGRIGATIAAAIAADARSRVGRSNASRRARMLARSVSSPRAADRPAARRILRS